MLIEKADGVRSEIAEIFLLWKLTWTFHSMPRNGRKNQYRSGGRSDHMIFCLFVHLFLSEQSIEMLPVSKIV